MNAHAGIEAVQDRGKDRGTGGTVIVIHGLARSASPMEKLATAARNQGYAVFNLDYPSTSARVEVLVDAHLVPVVRQAVESGATRIHFLTHSMGGILVRQFLATHELPPQLGRVVMMGPPNRGSELVDTFGWLPVFQWIYGPAGRQLGTGPDSLPNRLPPVSYPVGVIAGSSTISPLYSWIIPGRDDGKVAVKRTQVQGMADFVDLPVNHTWMMRNDEVIRQSLYFLREGRFDHAGPSTVRPGVGSGTN
ncbi:MAG: esterase/lipase family protein [Panacagrimonas sp.]